MPISQSPPAKKPKTPGSAPSVVDEQDFITNYDEEGLDEAVASGQHRTETSALMKTVVKEATDQTHQQLLVDLCERPSVVASAVTGVTKQLISTSSEFAEMSLLNKCIDTLKNQQNNNLFYDLKA